VTFRGKDIFSYRPPRSGVRFSAYYEWREAAHWEGIRWSTFCRLPGEEQSAIVAHFRVHHQTEAVVAHEQDKEAKRRARQPKT